MKVGILSDIHENVGILMQALKSAGSHKCDELVCLGDIAGYDRRFFRYHTERSAKKCLDLVRSCCRWIVPGNHDLFAAGRFPSYSNGFDYPANWFMMDHSERKRISGGKVWCFEGDDPNDLGENEKSFLMDLPEYVIENFNGTVFLFSHYIYPDVTGSTTQYVERKKQLRGLWEFMERKEINISLCGHSHNYFVGFAYPGYRSSFRAIHYVPNKSFRIGSEMVNIILPALSGDKGRTAFSIIDTASMQLDIISVGHT